MSSLGEIGAYVPMADAKAAVQQPEPQEPQTGGYVPMAERKAAAFEQDTSDRFMGSFRAAMQADPDTAAEARRIAVQIGAPSTTAVEDNIDVARQLVKEKAVQYQELKQRFPILLEQLEQVDFVRMAHDDIDNLKTTESLFGQFWQDIDVGQMQNERGYLGVKKALDMATKEDEARLQQIEFELRGQRRGFIPGATQIVGQMVGTVPQALVVGGIAAGVSGPAAPGAFAVGAGATMFTQAALIEGGNAYVEMLQRGYDPNAAKAAAFGVGVVNGALELWGLKMVGAPFRKAIATMAEKTALKEMERQAGRGALNVFVREYAKGLGGEVATESMQEVAQILGEHAAAAVSDQKAPWFVPPDTLAQSASRVSDIAWQTAQGMTLLGFPGPFLSYWADQARLTQAPKQQQFLDAIRKSAEASKLNERAPASLEGFIKKASAGKAENVYFDAAKFVEVLNQTGFDRQQLAETMPEVAAQLDVAEKTGGDVVIPMEQFAVRLNGKTEAGKAIGDQLALHARIDPDGVSQFEAEEAQKEAKAKAEELRKMVVEKTKNDTEFAAQATKARDDFAAQLTDAKVRGMTPQNVRDIATGYQSFVVTTAVREGKSPSQIVAENPLTVASKEAGGTALHAPAVESPEFQNWFQGSKVVDEEGKPLVVYHGTASDNFEEFRGASFFTDSTDDAALFAGSGTTLGEAYAPLTPGARLLPTYLSLRKPQVVDVRGAVFDFTKMEKMLAAAKQAGADGLVVRNIRNARGASPSTTFVAFSPTQIKSVNNRGTFDQNDPNILHAGGNRAGFDPSSLSIELYKKADATSVLHELGHFFLTVYGRIAQATQDAGSAIARDFAVFLKAVGVKDAQTWAGMTLEQQRKHHETFAYNFEDWLFHGKAPSVALEGLFGKFSAWLRRTYGNVRDVLSREYRRNFGVDLPILTPEVRGVFDRMLASEDEIAQAEAIRGMTAQFLTREQFVAAGNQDDQWQEYQDASQAAHDDAVAILTRDSLRQMAWLEGARGRVLAAMQAETKEARRAAREAVTAEVMAQPVYKAMAALKGDGPKLNTAAVKDLLPEGTDIKALRSLTKADGVLPDVAAQMFGYESGEQLVMDLLTAPDAREIISQRTDAVMLANHSDLMDPEAHKLAVERALHNEARARFVAVQAKFATKTNQPVRQLKASATAAARQILSTMRVGDIKPSVFAVAEARAARAVQKAQKAGDTAAEAVAWRNQLLQNQLASEAVKVREERTKAERAFARFRQSDKKVAKTRDVDLVNAGRALAGFWKLGPAIDDGQQSDIVARSVAALREPFPTLWGRVQDFLGLSKPYGADAKNLTLEQFRDLADLGDILWRESRTEKLLDANGKRVELDEADSAIAAQVNSTPERTAPGSKAAENETPSAFKRKVLKAWSAVASTKRVDHLAYFLDGGSDGPIHRFIVTPVRKQLDKYGTHLDKLTREIYGKLKALAKEAGNAWYSKFEAPELYDSRKTGEERKPFVFRGIKELVGVLRHVGSHSNLQKLLVGRGWGEMVEDLAGEPMLDSSRFDGFIKRMFDDGKLTKQHVDYVQSIWKMYADLLPLNQATHKAVYGYEFETIELRKVQTPFGELEGGYVPAIADPDAMQAPRPESLADSLEGLEQDFQYAVGTGKNHTLERNPNYNQPLHLNVGAETRHLAQHLRFIYLQAVVKDSARIMRAPKFVEAMNAYDREAIRSIWNPWLMNTARQASSITSEHPIVDSVASMLRKTTSLAYLGFNVVNSLVQASGILNGMATGSGKHTAAALWMYTKNPREAMRTAHEKSALMRRRFDPRMRKMQDDLHILAQSEGPGRAAYAAVKAPMVRAAFIAQSVVQSIADVVTWHAAYAKAVSEQVVGGEMTEAQREAAAVAAADDAVVRSQGSGNPENKAAFEITTPAMQLLTQFMSYGNLVLGTVMFSRNKGRALLWAILLPALAEAVIRQAALGRVDDPDDDGYADELASTYGKSVARNVAGMVPILGPLAVNMVGGDIGRGVGSPAGTVLQSAMQGIPALWQAAQGEDVSATEARSIAMILTMLTGMPLTPAGRAVAYEKGVESGRNPPPSGALDELRGMAVGR